MSNEKNPGVGLTPNPAPKPIPVAPPATPAFRVPQFAGGIEPGSLRGRSSYIPRAVSTDDADEELLRHVAKLNAKEFKEQFLGPTEKAKANWRRYQDALSRRGK